MHKVAYYNGRVYTADQANPEADAFIVSDGRFVSVGTDIDLQSCDELVDLGGKCVIPGLVDSHCHFLAGVSESAFGLLFVDPLTKPEELGDALKSLLAGSPLPSGRTIAAMGINLTLGDWRAEHIDCAIPDTAAVVFSQDGHALLLNTKAMEQLGISRLTKDPSPASYYVRDDNGDPTGLVLEPPAMEPCMQILERDLPIEERMQAIRDVAAGYASYGYTSVFEAMSSYDEQTEDLAALHALDGQGLLPLRIVTSFRYMGENDNDAKQTVELMKLQWSKYQSDHVLPNTLKLITDGTVEEHTALLYEPYADDASCYGSSFLSDSAMLKVAELAAAEGFSIHMHAIGDKAVTRALDVLCALGNIEGTKTIAHNQLYSEADIERIARAQDIYFQTTPQWMKDDDYTKSYLGPERFIRQFPVGTMQKNGVPVTFGSDSCLEPETADAFLGMFVASTRGDSSACPNCLPSSDEQLTREECLHAYTIQGAQQLGLDNQTGSITPGKAADFVVINRDIMKCPPEELKETKVLKTYFEGREIYSLPE